MPFVEEWSPEAHARLVAMAAEGLSTARIAVELGCSRNAVIGRAKRHGVTLLYRKPAAAPKPARAQVRRGRRPVAAEVVAHMRELYLAGSSVAEIANAAQVSVPTVARYCRDLPRRRIVTWSTKRKDRAFRLGALTAVLVGESAARAARRLGCSEHSIQNWRRDASLVADAHALAERIKGRWAEEARAAAEAAAVKAEEDRHRVERLNAPIFAQMSPRHREICSRRVAGETLETIGRDFGVTRERVRQIEAKWRLRGLIVPGAKPLNVEAAKKIGCAPKRARTKPAVLKDAAYWSAKIDAVIAAHPMDRAR